MSFVYEVPLCLISVYSFVEKVFVCIYRTFCYPYTWLQYAHKYLFPIICNQNFK